MQRVPFIFNIMGVVFPWMFPNSCSTGCHHQSSLYNKHSSVIVAPLQILGSRKAVTALANLLPIHIPLTADLLNALVILCSGSPSHVRMMLDAGALPWLLAFAAGSSTPSADPLNRRGAAVAAPTVGAGVPADDWPIVRMFAAELLDMVGDMVDERSGACRWLLRHQSVVNGHRMKHVTLSCLLTGYTHHRFQFLLFPYILLLLMLAPQIHAPLLLF